MKLRNLTLNALLAACFSVVSASAATLNVSGGQLTGASDVDVGGVLYDVEFIDGTCAAVFTGCDDSADFTFGTSSDATAASQALLDQVFTGSFDGSPALTFGCTYPFTCIATTVYNTTSGRGAFNHQEERFDQVISTFPIGDTSDQSENVYAKWTAVVPVPASLPLLIAGLGGLALMRRRRTAS